MKVVMNILAVIVVVALCVWAFQYWRQQKIENSGEVNWVSGQPSPEQKAAFDKKNSGDDSSLSNAAAAKTRTAQETMTQQTMTQPVVSHAPADLPASQPTTVTPPVTSRDGSQTNYTQTSASAAIPAHDSLAPNPPNGSAFSGTGQYLLYRQGDLTWELNTSTGRTCIKFATMEEWRRSLVLRNGCGHAA